MVPSPLAFNRSPSQDAAGLSLPRNNLKALYQGAVLDVFYKAHILRPSRQAIVCWMSFASFQTAFACLGKGFWGGQVGGRPPQPTSGLSISLPSPPPPPFSPCFCKGVSCEDFVPLFSHPTTICPSAGRTMNTKWCSNKGGRGGIMTCFGSSPTILIREAVAASRAKDCLSPPVPVFASRVLLTTCLPWHSLGLPGWEGWLAQGWVEDVQAGRNPHPHHGLEMF